MFNIVKQKGNFSCINHNNALSSFKNSYSGFRFAIPLLSASAWSEFWGQIVLNKDFWKLNGLDIPALMDKWGKWKGCMTAAIIPCVKEKTVGIELSKFSSCIWIMQAADQYWTGLALFNCLLTHPFDYLLLNWWLGEGEREVCKYFRCSPKCATLLNSDGSYKSQVHHI